MIISFSHKGLEIFFTNGNKKGIIATHADKLARVLDRLDTSLSPEDMNLQWYSFICG